MGTVIKKKEVAARKGDREMLLLWNMVKRFFDEDWTAGVFLAANMFLWTALSCGVGMLFCMVAAGAEAASCAANVLCMSIYAGIIVGLFGGIWFLFRRQS